MKFLILLLLGLFANLTMPARAAIYDTITLAAGGPGERAPGMLIIIFWLLLLLWAIGALGFVNPANPNYPNIVRGTNVVIVILFAILGFYTFGF